MTSSEPVIPVEWIEQAVVAYKSDQTAHDFGLVLLGGAIGAIAVVMALLLSYWWLFLLLLLLVAS